MLDGPVHQTIQAQAAANEIPDVAIKSGRRLWRVAKTRASIVVPAGSVTVWSFPEAARWQYFVRSSGWLLVDGSLP